MTGQAKTFLTSVAAAEGWQPATLLELLYQFLDAERALSRDSYERLADFIGERVAGGEPADDEVGEDDGTDEDGNNRCTSWEEF